MKISALPLAAALLAAASSAPAQSLAAPAFGFGPQSASPFGASSGSVDMVEKCSTVPYRACTTEELNMREARKAGTCTEKDFICQRRLMEASSQGNSALQQLGNEGTPSGTKPFYLLCGTVPYRSCTPKEEKEKELAAADKAPKTEEPGVNDNIQGPPQMLDMPKGGPEGKMLQYPSGRVEYCFDNSCSKTSGKPMTPAEAKKYLKEQYADQKQIANSLNGGGEPINASRNAGGGKSGDKSGDRMGSNSADETPVQGGNNPTAYGGGPQTPGARTDSAKNDAADVYNAQRNVASTGGDSGSGRSGTVGPSGSSGPGSSGPSSYSGRSGSSGSGSGSWGAGNSGRSGGDDEVIYAPGRKLDEVEVTYRGHQRLEQDIKRTAGTFNTGKLTGFASPNEPVGGTAGDPPISPEHLGKQQFSANAP